MCYKNTYKLEMTWWFLSIMCLQYKFRSHANRPKPPTINVFPKQYVTKEYRLTGTGMKCDCDQTGK